ncbi:MAG: 30S ribosomal protein S13 [Patescibacteria group bacterium]
MIRISGIILPNDKRIEVALTYLFGIGLTRSKQILAECGIDPNIRTKDLTEEQANIIRTATTKFKVEGDLKKEISKNVNLMKEIGCYKGSRHAKRLPVRGQRTKTNSRTVRGNKRGSAGSGKIAVTKK